MDVFNVLTEFRFNAGEAILESDRLKHAVEGVSDAADRTALAFQSLGAGIVGHLDILHGGLVGGLLEAIKVSDRFNLQASTFANIIQANMSHMIGNVDTFNDRLDVSKQILMDIHNVAFKFGLDEKALFGAAQGITATLAPHGLAGKNMSTGIDIARMSLKAAPALQMMPQNVEQELIRIITGQANSNETLFRRLVTDTTSMKQFQIQGTGAFNALPIAKRLEFLQKALNEFSRDTQVAEFNMRSLHNQLVLLENAFTGIASILKPIGDLLLPIVQNSLMALNKYIETTARTSIENIAKAMKPFTEDPTRTLADVMTLRHQEGIVHTAKNFFVLFGHLRLLDEILQHTPFKLNAFSKAIHMVEESIFPDAAFVGFFKKLFSAVTGGGAEGLIGAAGAAVFELAETFSKIFMLLEILEKGFQYAKIADVEFITAHMDILTGIFQKFSKILLTVMGPINDGIDAIARFIGWLFSFGAIADFTITAIDKLLNVFSYIVDGVNILLSPLYVLGGVLGGIAGLFSGGGLQALKNFSFAEMIESTFDDFFKKKLINQPVEKVVGKSVTNIGKVEMRLDFKENMQPDRVAFTIVEQLKKVGQNPTQGRGSTFTTHALTGAASQ